MSITTVNLTSRLHRMPLEAALEGDAGTTRPHATKMLGYSQSPALRRQQGQGGPVWGSVLRGRLVVRVGISALTCFALPKNAERDFLLQLCEGIDEATRERLWELRSEID